MNINFEKRVCQLIAITYALSFNVVYNSYTRLNSFDKIIKLAEDGTLEKLDN